MARIGGKSQKNLNSMIRGQPSKKGMLRGKPKKKETLPVVEEILPGVKIIKIIKPLGPHPLEREKFDVEEAIQTLLTGIELVKDVTEITTAHIEKIWESFTQGEHRLRDSELKRLVVDLLTLGRYTAQCQIARQQQAVMHVQKVRKENGCADDEDDLRDLLLEVHERYPSVGKSNLRQIASAIAVSCNRDINRARSDATYLSEVKEMFDQTDDIDRQNFIDHFPALYEYLYVQTNLFELSEIAPIQGACCGKNLHWHPEALPIGDIIVHVEFSLEELEDLPDNMDFSIPPNVTVKQFVDHLLIIYPELREFLDFLEIQIITTDSIDSVELDDDRILENDVELVFLD